jgi:hypothetical protein
MTAIAQLPSRTVDTAPKPLADIIRALSLPLPPEYLATRKQGGQTLTYIPWYRANALLDRYAPGWELSSTVTTVGGYVVVTASLTIHAADGTFTRTATGSEPLDSKGWGDPCSCAESMAFRRAAARFGLGLYLYHKSNR